MKQTCKQCGKEFELTDGEIKFYKDKGLSLPKRCEECRKANRTEKDGAQKKSGGKKGKIGAIAAAAIVAVGLIGGHSLNNNSDTAYIPPAVTQQAESDIADNALAENDAVQAEDTENADIQNSDTQSGDTAAENNVVSSDNEASENTAAVYRFRNEKTLRSHFEKHGGEFNGLYKNAAEYEAGASAVVNSPEALHKLEAEDGDDVYYLEKTNEFVIVSKDGYIRTYFKPNAGKAYYDRQ